MDNPFVAWDIWEEASKERVRKAAESRILAANYSGAKLLYEDPRCAIHFAKMEKYLEQLSDLHIKMAEEYQRLADAVQRKLEEQEDGHELNEDDGDDGSPEGASGSQSDDSQEE